MKTVKEVRKFFRFDERGKVSFALVAVLVLMLSTVSMVYIAAINRMEREREREDDTNYAMEHKVNVAQAEIETQAYILAMDAIYKATQDENDQNRIIPIFEKEFGKYLEKYTDDDGFEEGDYYIRVEDYTVSLSLDSKITDDFIPTVEPGTSGGNLIQGTEVNPTELDGISTENSDETGDTQTNVYYQLDGNIQYRVLHKQSNLGLSKNMTLSRSIMTPYPMLNTKFNQFGNYATAGSGEFGRMMQYILTTVAQFKVFQGYGALDLGEDSQYGSTADIITINDIELAINLAILLETAKMYRNYDLEHLNEFDEHQFDPDFEVGTPMDALITNYIANDQIDGADIVALYKFVIDGEITINLEIIFGQAIYALVDQFLLKYLDYSHLAGPLDFLYESVQIVQYGIEDFFDWVTDLFTGDEETDNRAEITKKWVAEQFDEVMLDSSIMYDVTKQIEKMEFPVGFTDEENCHHNEDSDDDGSKDDPVEYRSRVDSKYTVIIPKATMTVDFEEKDIFRDDMDGVWISYYEENLNDEEKRLVLSIRETVKLISLKVAEEFTKLPGLKSIIDKGNSLMVEAIDPDDDTSLMEEISEKIDGLLIEIIDYFKSPAGRDGIKDLIVGLVSEQKRLYDALYQTLDDYFDTFSDMVENNNRATDKLTEELINSAIVNPGNGVITPRDNPQGIKYPDQPPLPQQEPGRLNFNVPYIHQVIDTPNWFNGHSACGAASAMMAFGYYGIIEPNNWGSNICEKYTYNGHTYDIGSTDPSGKTAHGGYGFITQQNWKDTKGFMAQYATQHGLNSGVDWSPTWAELTGEIDAGHPVVLLTSLTGPGHYVLAIGYDVNKQVVIVNDPYGNKNQGYMNYNGAGVEYDWPGNNNGHANLNTVHCFIYFQGQVPDTRSRGDITPDEWEVMQCPYDEHPALDENSLPKRSKSQIIDKFKTAWGRNVEDIARKLVEEAYEEVRKVELEKFKNGINNITLDIEEGIIGFIVDKAASALHWSGLIPRACELVKVVLNELINSTEMRKIKYFLPLNMGEPLRFWSGDINRPLAEKNGRAYFENIYVNMTPNYLVNGRDITITKGEPHGVHYTDPLTFHTKPFETTWNISITGKFNFSTKSEQKNLEFEGRHLAVGKKGVINLDISVPVTVFSGWDLQDVKYKCSDTLLGDLFKRIAQFFSEVWENVKLVVGWLISGLMKVLTILVNIIHAIVNFASKIIKVIVDAITWVIDKIKKFIQESVDLLAKVVDGVAKFLGDKFNVTIFGIIFNVTTIFADGDKPADGWDWVSRISSRFNVKDFGFGFDLSIVQRNRTYLFGLPQKYQSYLAVGSVDQDLKEALKESGVLLSGAARIEKENNEWIIMDKPKKYILDVTPNGLDILDDSDDYDILITSGLKIGNFILEIAIDPLMTVWPRFIEGHGIYLNETGQGFGIDFTSPEITTGWSALGSIKFNKTYIKKVIKLPASKITIPHVGTAQAELGIKLSWGKKKVPIDMRKEIAPLLNKTFYEVWHGLGGKFPMDSNIIDNYSQELLKSFEKNLGPVFIKLASKVKLEIWLKLTLKPFGGRFKVGGLSGYTVVTTTLKLDTNFGNDMVKNFEYFKSWSQKYLDEQRGGKKEPEIETGIDVSFSIKAKVHLKKIFSSPVTIPVIGVNAKGEVGFSVSCGYKDREELSKKWDSIKSKLSADWEDAKAGQTMKNLAGKAKGLLEYLGDNTEFRTWMKLHLSKEFGSYGDLGATINVDFIIKGKDTVVDGFNWIISNIDKYLINPGENITASPPPNVIMKFYVTTEIGIRHKVAKIPIPAIGCTADVTIGFKFTLKFKETTNLSNFIDFMNMSFDAVDNETNSTPRDQNLITIYAQKIIVKFKEALDYVLDNGQISFYVRFDLDVGGLDALEAGVVLKFIMKCSLRGVWEVAKWIMGNIGAFVNNVLNPTNAAKYPDVPKEYLEKIIIELELFVQAGLPDAVKDLTAGMVGFKARMSIIIKANLPLLAAAIGQDWGRYAATFGMVLKLDLTIKIGIDKLFNFMDVEMHPHAWFRLWFFQGRIYEIE